MRYKAYKKASGRSRFIETHWGYVPNILISGKTYSKPPENELNNLLTPLQYHVTQQNGTERPFDHEYWNNKDDGIYVDVVSGEPLFISRDNFKSRTGWPSFTQPLESENIVEVKDRSLFTVRTEINRPNYARYQAGEAH